MESLTKSILSTLEDRALAGAGKYNNSEGGALMDHSVYGGPVRTGAVGAAKPKKARKKKAKCCEHAEEVAEVAAPAIVELVAAGKGKKKKRVVSAEGKAKRKATAAGNPWLIHVAKFRKEHPGMKPTEVTKAAKATYTKKE